MLELEVIIEMSTGRRLLVAAECSSKQFYTFEAKPAYWSLQRGIQSRLDCCYPRVLHTASPIFGFCFLRPTEGTAADVRCPSTH